MTYHLVLVKDIHLWEAKGWRYTGDKVEIALGGMDWASVYMEKDD